MGITWVLLWCLIILELSQPVLSLYFYDPIEIPVWYVGLAFYLFSYGQRNNYIRPILVKVQYYINRIDQLVTVRFLWLMISSIMLSIFDFFLLLLFISLSLNLIQWSFYFYFYFSFPYLCSLLTLSLEVDRDIGNCIDFSIGCSLSSWMLGFWSWSGCCSVSKN